MNNAGTSPALTSGNSPSDDDDAPMTVEQVNDNMNANFAVLTAALANTDAKVAALLRSVTRNSNNFKRTSNLWNQNNVPTPPWIPLAVEDVYVPPLVGAPNPNPPAVGSVPTNQPASEAEVYQMTDAEQIALGVQFNIDFGPDSSSRVLAITSFYWAHRH